MRADFRRYYSVRYEDVSAEEAIDLISCLPHGSAYRAARLEFGEWSDEQNALADIVDALYKLIFLLSSKGTTEGAPIVDRPQLKALQAQARRRAQHARQTITNTMWEAV